MLVNRSVMFCFSLVAVHAGCGSDQGGATCDTPGVGCDVVLSPPSKGIQYMVGPIEVDPGNEVLRCYWRKVPYEMDIGRIQIAYNLGSHHLDIFTTNYWRPDGDFDCSKPEEWGAWPSQVALGLDPKAPMPEMVVGFQNERIDWALPSNVGYHLRAGQQLMIQSHFANAASQKTPTSRLLNFINLVTVDTKPADHASTLFDEDMKLEIPARSQKTLHPHLRVAADDQHHRPVLPFPLPRKAIPGVHL